MVPLASSVSAGGPSATSATGVENKLELGVPTTSLVVANGEKDDATWVAIARSSVVGPTFMLQFYNQRLRAAASKRWMVGLTLSAETFIKIQWWT